MLACSGLVCALAALPCADAAYAVGETATAVIKLASGADAGTVTFTEGTAGVLLKFELKGLPPGPTLSMFTRPANARAISQSAGGIYNPLGAKHGFLHDEGPMAGDLPNIYAGCRWYRS